MTLRLPMSGTSADAAAAFTTRETFCRFATAVVFPTRAQAIFCFAEREKDMAKVETIASMWRRRAIRAESSPSWASPFLDRS